MYIATLMKIPSSTLDCIEDVIEITRVLRLKSESALEVATHVLSGVSWADSASRPTRGPISKQA